MEWVVWVQGHQSTGHKGLNYHRVAAGAAVAELAAPIGGLMTCKEDHKKGLDHQEKRGHMKQKYAAHIAQRLDTSDNVNDMLSQIQVNTNFWGRVI